MAINGVERIAERILRDAQTEAAGIKKVADENCAVIDAQYEKQAKDAAASILEAAEKEAGELIKRMKGEADMRARSALLEEKQALMQKAFEAAQQELLNMDEETYRAFLVKLACRASVSGQEELVACGHRRRMQAPFRQRRDELQHRYADRRAERRPRSAGRGDAVRVREEVRFVQDQG